MYAVCVGTSELIKNKPLTVKFVLIGLILLD